MIPKSTRNFQNTLKSRCLKQIYFRMRFYAEFSLNSWARSLKNSNFPQEKQRFSENRRFLKDLPKIDFYFHFGPPKPPKIAPKSLQNRKKSRSKTKIRVNMRVCNFFPKPQRGGARRNAPHPARQAQEASKKLSICLSI